MGAIVAIAGNLASGKSTLAAGVAAATGWALHPTTGYDRATIDDLFADPPRWAFEAQMHFLAHKADAVLAAAAAPTPAVLDRSIGEDVEIFARYCLDRGWMTERAHTLYRRYASLVLAEVAAPRVVVYCAAGVAACTRRMRERPRPYQALYPPQHLERLHESYEAWWGRLDGPVKLRVDTEVRDVRDGDVVTVIAREVVAALGAP